MNVIDRPVLIFGAGIQSCRDEAVIFANHLQIPVCLTWGAADLLPDMHPLRVGTFGTHGTRAANYTVQNADYLLCIGARLDTKATGTPAKWFARNALINMVDIDPLETEKMRNVGVKVNAINMDAAIYMRQYTCSYKASEWINRCQQWVKDYPVGPGIAYDTMHRISDATPNTHIIVSDTGCVLAWAMQAWRFKEGQRFLHPFNQTPMGYALPAAVGAHYATGKPITVLTGDGSIMMNIGELTTIAQRKLPIKIYLLDNKGHAMCRQSQREWLGGTYPTTSLDGGLSFPDFHKIANAFNVDMTIIDIPPDEDVSPKAKFGYPNEDQYPHLPREEFARNMLIPMVSP